MSIRLRTIEGVRVALCAARSVPAEGDVYLDDADHRALGVKFDLDFASEGRMESLHADSREARLIDVAESNNANRRWWDSQFAPRPNDTEVPR